MILKRSREITGLFLEVLGLAVLLFASIWQAFVTDWLDNFPVKSQYYIQETANLAVLRSLDGLVQIAREDDPTRRKVEIDKVSMVAKDAQFQLIEIRDRTEKVEHDQGSWLKFIRHTLFVIGAAFIIFGKFFVLLHKAKNTGNV